MSDESNMFQRLQFSNCLCLETKIVKKVSLEDLMKKCLWNVIYKKSTQPSRHLLSGIKLYRSENVPNACSWYSDCVT